MFTSTLKDDLFVGVCLNHGTFFSYFDRENRCCVYVATEPLDVDYCSEEECVAQQKEVWGNPWRYVLLPRFEDFDFKTAEGMREYDLCISAWCQENEI